MVGNNRHSIDQPENYDCKYDFGSGEVSFVPFLTEPNPEATSSVIPEFPSIIILPLFLVVTLLVIIY